MFDSDTHGYNTRDYRKIDCRLGTNEDFAKVCKELHENGIKVVLDGVFNHVGRGFWAFQDVLKTVRTHHIKIGSISISVATATITMDFGMRAGRVTLTLLS